jgi:hypothetical protein
VFPKAPIVPQQDFLTFFRLAELVLRHTTIDGSFETLGAPHSVTCHCQEHWMKLRQHPLNANTMRVLKHQRLTLEPLILEKIAFLGHDSKGGAGTLRMVANLDHVDDTSLIIRTYFQGMG